VSALEQRLGALAPIVARKQQEAADLRCAAGTLWAKAEAMPVARGFVASLRGGTVVAEMKRRSPSGGALRDELDPAAVARGYSAAGAAALSVLTDGPDFGGSLDDMVAARDAVEIPVLRKDFIVDPVQIAEARVAGADAVLLIVAVLSDDELAQCLDAAGRFGIDAVVEVHDAEETQRALAAGASCIGVNNRDLRSLTTDLATFARLRALIPTDVVCVAESGVRSAADVRRLVGEGADAVLVGETLMRSDDPAAACRALVEAARGR
jgi:indole-3-glycerol phosphate synthase